MARRIPTSTSGADKTVGIVLARFHQAIADMLLRGAMRALKEQGVSDKSVVVASVAGALEIPLALQRMAQTGDYDGLIALGAVIRGETYHFEIVAGESAGGISSVQLEFGIPVGNGVLTTNTDLQAETRADQKGYEAALVALEMANLLHAIDEE